jgi:4-amino-4-deoxychorismate lyase
MSLFIESIQLKDGEFKRLAFHQARVQNAISDFYPQERAFDLAEFLDKSTFPTEGIYKCRIVFDSEVRQVEFLPYTRRDIKSLKLVDTEIESRRYKMEDRSGFNAAFEKRDSCDDVLLVKDGLLTDSSYCNIALFDGENWVTPRVPLLYGVNRAQLLNEGKLIEKDIAVVQLKNYRQIALFNAMIELGELVLDIDKIF